MHLHHEVEQIDTKQKFKKLRTTLIHLGVSILIILIAPWFFNLFTRQKIEQIRSENPSATNASALQYYQGRVETVNAELFPDEINNDRLAIQKMEVKPVEGPEAGQLFSVEVQINPRDELLKYKEGDKIVLIRSQVDGQTRYFLSERYRLDSLLIVGILFLILVLFLVGFRGITAIAGLVFSVLALTNFLIPLIISGQNVVLVTFLTGLIIMTISLYLSHGVNKAMTISLLGSIITITLATIASIGVVYLTKLSGTGTDEAFQLQFASGTSNLNFRGLLLSALIIGSLGVLDDITTSQAMSVQEISKANPKLNFKELYLRAMRVGQEHIISVVNTLGLAYVSVALPFIMFLIIYNQTPLWVSLNSEIIAEELIRTIVGSSTLLLAVPITTLLAATFLKSNTKSLKPNYQEDDHHHFHSKNSPKNQFEKPKLQDKSEKDKKSNSREKKKFNFFRKNKNNFQSSELKKLNKLQPGKDFTNPIIDMLQNGEVTIDNEPKPLKNQEMFDKSSSQPESRPGKPKDSKVQL